ncbi:MAG: hypothetical protein IPH06_02370 [Alphaproteobacteria bacterium]|nr:hypothetical protein [Alphaproteobacteria bacterium]QQS56895.1 MAG: hypothetical protein IPN28_11625 [Alphaproteobacteria bacterium]
MGKKTFAAATGAGLLVVFGAPLAYHTRDVHFYPEDTCSITEQADGKHLRVIDTRMKEIADIRLVQNDGGALVGQGAVYGDEFQVQVAAADSEAVFIHKHGPEKLWLGRDVVHVARSDSNSSESVPEPHF